MKTRPTCDSAVGAWHHLDFTDYISGVDNAFGRVRPPVPFHCMFELLTFDLFFAYAWVMTCSLLRTESQGGQDVCEKCVWYMSISCGVL